MPPADLVWQNSGAQTVGTRRFFIAVENRWRMFPDGFHELAASRTFAVSRDGKRREPLPLPPVDLEQS